MLVATLILGGIFFELAYADSIVHPVLSSSPEKTISDNKIQPPVRFDTIWADSNGSTHIGRCRFEGLIFKSYAPPSAPQWIGSSLDEVESIAYAVLPPGYIGTWHRAPGPQWVVTLSGKWSVETTDGTVLTQGPGQFQFNADSSSHPRKHDERIGHISRTIGDEPNVQMIIKLKPNARARGICAN
nr:hypothetical protein [Rosenbergiella collisarenosi]